jgi:CDP-paratose 2-epimerase
MSIALITGSCGLIGSESAYFFESKGLEIVGIDNNFRQFFFGKEGSTVWQKNKLKKKIKNYKH